MGGWVDGRHDAGMGSHAPFFDRTAALRRVGESTDGWKRSAGAACDGIENAWSRGDLHTPDAPPPCSLAPVLPHPSSSLVPPPSPLPSRRRCSLVSAAAAAAPRRAGRFTDPSIDLRTRQAMRAPSSDRSHTRTRTLLRRRLPLPPFPSSSFPPCRAPHLSQAKGECGGERGVTHARAHVGRRQWCVGGESSH